jgi:5-methylcytosine-specific restriction endonuclease McrA
MKRCGHCRKMLPLGSFAKNRSMDDGLQHYCRICSKAAKQRYRQSEKGKLTVRRYDRRPSLAKYTKSEKFKIQQRRYHQSEKGRITARRATQRHRQTEQGKLYEQQYRRSEERKLSLRRYEKSEKGQLTKKRNWQSEKSRVRARDYREAHKEKHELYYRAWLRTPEGKEYMIRRNYQRRASILQTPSEQLLTPTEWREIKRQFHNVCAYCGIPESVTVKLTRDHLIPVSKSGLHTKENIVPACQPCNAKKGAKLLHHLPQR